MLEWVLGAGNRGPSSGRFKDSLDAFDERGTRAPTGSFSDMVVSDTCQSVVPKVGM